MEKVKKIKKSKETVDIIKIIKECSNSDVRYIKIGDIEIEFNERKVKPDVIAELPEDPEFDKEAKEGKKDMDEFYKTLEQENEIADDFEKHEADAVMNAMEAE